MADNNAFSLIDVPEQFNIAAELFQRNIQAGRSEKTAVIYREQKVSYQQLLEQSNRMGNALRSLGVERENRVMILLPECPEAVYSILGAILIGAVAVPVSTMTVPDEYEYFLNDSRAKVLIVDSSLLPLVDPVRQNCRYLRHVIVVGEARDGDASCSQLMATAASELEAAATHQDDMAFWLYSSGTTGRPKGIIHLHHDMVYANEALYVRLMQGGPGDILYSAARLFFGFGLASSIFHSFWAGSTTVLVPERPTPEVLAQNIDRYRVTFLCAAPTIYAGVLRLVNTGSFDFSSIRIAISAGEALPPTVWQQWKDQFGIELLVGLGSSDAQVDYIQNPPGRCRPETVGLVLDGYEINIVDETGIAVPQGEVGELLLKGESLTPYYWHKHQKTKEMILGEWLRTGDTVWQDADGYIHYVGRTDDVFKSSGIWVSPTEVENVLVSHEQVLEAGVVGLPDQDGLYKTSAFVVPKPGVAASEALAKELKTLVRNTLGNHKAPHQVRFADSLPRTATGKIQRFKLRQLYQLIQRNIPLKLK